MFGTQSVKKFRGKDQVVDLVDIGMMMIRIPEKQTDIILSVNTPRSDETDDKMTLEEMNRIFDSFKMNDLSLLI